MREQEIERQAKEVLLNCLKEIPFLRVQSVKIEGRGGSADLCFEVESERRRTHLVAEVKKIGQPRMVREAVNSLLRYREKFPEAYAVFVAPYVSPQAAEICTKEGIGFMDMAGNCRLCFDKVFI